MKKEILLNGMNKKQLEEGKGAALLLSEGFDMLINQIQRIESGENVARSEIRIAKLKLTESMYIMNDLDKEQQANEKYYNNPNKPFKPGKKHGKR